MGLGEKLRVLRVKRDVSQRDLAKEVETSYTTISMIESSQRANVSARIILAIAKFFGIDPADLLDDKVSTSALLAKLEQKAQKKPDTGNLDIVPLDSLLEIPVLARVPCGMPAQIPKELVVGRITLPLAWVKDKEAFAVVAKGDSMTGFGVNDGDHIVISRNIEVKHGSVALVELRGQVTVRKVFFQDQQTLLQSGHPESTPVIVSGEDGFKIVGKVVFTGRNVE